MKPLRIKAIGLLSVALAMSSCSEDSPFGPDAVKESRSIVAELAQEEMSSRSCIDESTLDSRYIDVLWEPTDTLGVYGQSTRNAMFLTTDNRTSSASFSGEMTAGDTPTGVYYPYRADNNGRAATDLLGTLALTQDFWQRHPGVDNDWRVGTPTEREGVFRFRHLFTTLHFSVDAANSDLADQKLESIKLTITGQDGTKRQLGGDFSFSLADGFDRFTSTPTDANVITMRWRDCPELTAGRIYHGFITCAPTVKMGDKIDIEIRTTTKVARFSRTSLADFKANTGYTFPLTIKNYADIAVSNRTDVDAEALHHPSMILRHEDLARINHSIRTVPALAAMHRRIIALCEEYIGEPVVTNNAVAGKTRWTVSGGMDNGQSGAEVAATRIMSLAYAYRMTLDSRYADRAIKEMVSLASMSKKWSEYQALDAAEVMTGVAYGYDWLYDVMTAAQRSQVRSALKTKGLDVISEICQRSTNQNSVGNCGGVTAALALRNNSSYTSAANTAITRAQNYNKNVLETYTGNYLEGPAYWGYGTDYQVLMFQALEDVMGESAYTNILSSYEENFFKSARYMQMTIGSSGLTFNYSDTRMPTIFEMASFWFAYKRGDNSYAFADISAMKSDAYSYPACNYPAQFLVPLMSFASRVDFSTPNDPGVNYFVANESGDTQPIFVYRSGWKSPTDTYLAVKGGMANNTHGHMDAGSFVYDYNGERWACDLGGQDYALFEASGTGSQWNYANGGARWKIFRMKNEAHNTITINGAEHRSSSSNTSTVGLATITQTFQTDSKKGCVVNMTKALSYPTDAAVQNATRTIYVDDYNVLHIEDVIKAPSSKAANVTWTMVTDATPTLSGNDIILTKNGKQMKLSVVPTSAKAYIKDCKGPNSYDAENPGMSRVGFTHTITRNQQASINVQLEPVD